MPITHTGKHIVSRIVVIAALGMALTGLGSAFWIGRGILDTQKKVHDAGFTFSQSQSDSIAQKFDAEMAAQKQAADSLAKRLSSGEVDYAEVVPAMQAIIDQKPNLYGVVVGFAPDIYPGKRLYAPYFALGPSGRHVLTQVEERYDYADPALPGAAWYTQIAAAGKGLWIRQYGAVTQDWVILYAAPFYTTDETGGTKTLAGVVAATHAVDTTLKEFMESVDLGQDGYTLLFDEKGVIAYHPNPALIDKSILDIAIMGGETHGKTSMSQTRPKNDYIERKSTNQVVSWTTFRILPSSNWVVATVVYENAKAVPPRETFVQYVYFGLALLIGLEGLLLLILRPDKGTPHRLWAASFIGGLLIALCLFWIWVLAYTISFENKDMLVNYQNVAAALASADPNSPSVAQAPVQIPTGIMIENIRVSNDRAELSGYIWQRYPPDMEGSGQISGPRFPDAADSAQFDEVYRFMRNGKLVVGWVFNVELNQRFNFHQFPLDKIDVRILIEPGDYTVNAVMVPDFESYEYMAPGQKPGIKNDLTPVGWDINGSGFTYVQETYNTNFGGLERIYKNKYPVLAFNIQATRLILSPLIAYGIIILVLLVQVFGLLLFPISKPLESFSIASALLMVIAVAHNSLRSNLQLSGTVYLEYFLIFMYILVLFVGMIALLRTLAVKSRLLSQDALMIKLMFWPGYLLVVLVITLFVFYLGF